MDMKRADVYPMILAMLGAVLFGASAPLSKVFLGVVDPVLMAALLYLGSGTGLLIFMLARPFLGMKPGEKLVKADIPWLAGAVLAGGVAAPIVLMFGLRATPASTASLLLNFECVGTTVLAVFLFREHVGKRTWLAVGLITLSSMILSFQSGSLGLSVGALGIIVACILWGLDNNFTRNISTRDPLVIAVIKGLAAGSFSLVLALVLGNRMPPLPIVIGAMLLGCISYGLSVVLFIVAMRILGAARTSAWFGIAPFAGAAISFLVFQNNPGVAFLISLPLMILGAILLLGEEHGHVHMHVHGAITHEHLHSETDHHHDP
jgi:drug/metabolite transporter (DMT)-like permease